MINYVEAPTEYTGSLPSVFLAGGITDCPDWQSWAAKLLRSDEFAVLNPRRANFPIHDPSAAEAQIAWEFRHLAKATVVLFWFPGSITSSQPIALYELGRHAALGAPLAVGASVSYRRRQDVLIQLGHARPDVKVHDMLPAVCLAARKLLAANRSTGYRKVPAEWVDIATAHYAMAVFGPTDMPLDQIREGMQSALAALAIHGLIGIPDPTKDGDHD